MRTKLEYLIVCTAAFGFFVWGALVAYALLKTFAG